MTTTAQLQSAAQLALAAMRAAGFEHAQVTASALALSELSANESEPSLLRSTDSGKLSLMGIVDGRMASTELPGLSADAVAQRIPALLADAQAAPRDEANGVSVGQSAQIVQGPQEPDLAALGDKIAELLAFRAQAAPRMIVREAECSHRLHRWHVLTTGGSELKGSVGWYQMSAMGTARDGDRTSSFNYTAGHTHDVRGQAAPELFGLGTMMRELERQIVTRPFAEKFTGDVVLGPKAVDDVLGWLLGQLGDMQLISGSSLYRDKVGKSIASKLLTIRSRFDAPGVAAVSSDGFAARPLALLEDGVLRTLTPTLYGSRKTGLPHVPVASGGWDIAPGTTPLPDLIGGVTRGALVGRLSMGRPAANGNFSGVIKNSFAIEGGEVGHALSETMISGNMAQLLQDIVGVSRETQDGTGTRRPWLRVRGLHFS